MKHFFLIAVSAAVVLNAVNSYAASVSSDSAVQQPPAANASAKIEAAYPLPFKPGDALRIITYPDSAGFPAGFYPIDGEGFVDFPIIGYIKVTTISCDALAKLLAEKYVDFMRYPHMNIRPLIRVALNGGFYRPGLYWVNPHASLWDAVQIAGGTQRADGFKKIRWERNSAIVNPNVVPLLQDGKSLFQIGFKTGDQLTIIQKPQTTSWEVFKTELLPMVTFSISTVVSAFTIYNSMQMVEYYRSGRR